MSDIPVIFTPDELKADPILFGLAEDKIPLTRANYIGRNWPDNPEIDAELEAEIPEKLQDWSRFEDQPEA